MPILLEQIFLNMLFHYCTSLSSDLFYTSSVHNTIFFVQVTDVAGNRRRADTLVLYAPDSSLEADASQPITVQGVANGGRWLNSLNVKNVILLYSKHFKNQVGTKCVCTLTLQL